ncbi:uncharacterized protein [Parasteatoda tepidariorum]|uniref:uncharacterized protein n=1 Tax=Parasteatoda tepidariorum TaxID=114398 RepID=UPI00077FA5AE|nr:uncharacterized protein LOC107452324 [Parasteatoda tepidariorum]
MKQPRLPGAEKFKFSSSDKPAIHISSPKQRSLSVSQSFDNNSHKILSRRASCYSQSELSPSPSITMLNRSDSRRRAVLPITCKKTSRMLTNTNLELNVDIADTVSEEALKLNRLQIESNRVPSCPNLEASSRTFHSSKTSLDASHLRKMSLQNSMIRDLPPDFDWKNIRAPVFRLSASCSSASSSEENIWVLRENPEL